MRKESSSPRELSDADVPAVAIRDLTGVLRVWIDVGSPDAARLHRASKSAARVVVYTHKDPGQFLRNLSGERIHRVEALEINAVERAFVTALAARLERRMDLSIGVAGGDVSVSIGADTIAGTITRLTLE